MNAVSAYDDVKVHAESIKNDETHDLRNTMEVDDAWAQGDILIRMIRNVPAGSEIIAGESQLAPGNTQGSRHCIDTLEGVTMYRLKNPTPLEGPVFEAAAGCTVEHPEHGNVILGPGVYAIEYQRAFADELRRTID